MNEVVIVIIGIVIVFGVIIAIYVMKMQSSPKKIAEIEELLASGQYNTVVRMVNELVMKNRHPDISAKLQFFLGEAYQGIKEFTKAIPAYNKALSQSSTEGRAFELKVRNRVVDALLELGRVKAALGELIVITNMDANNPEPFFKMGKIYFNGSSYEKAEDSFKKATVIKSDHVESLQYLGYTRYHMGKEQEALKPLTLSLQIDPNSEKVHYFIGRIYRKQKEYTEALKEFEPLLQGTEYRTEAYLERGLCHIGRKEYETAAGELKEGIKIAGNKHQIMLAMRYALAACYEQMKQFANAVTQWEEIKKTDPTYKNITEKLETYGDLKQDTLMQEFLTASEIMYEDTVRRIVDVLELKTLELSFLDNGDLLVYAEEKDADKNVASNVKRRVIRVHRDRSRAVSAGEVRELVELAKKNSIPKCIFLSAGTFSPQAHEFATTRSVDLVFGDDMKSVIKHASFITTPM